MPFTKFLIPILLTVLLYSAALHAATPIPATLPEDKTKAVILAYHRIGEDNHPDTNLTQEQFIEHINEIENGDYTVLALDDVLSAIENRTPLPAHSIVLTFEGAYQSAYTNAIQHLLEKDWPFTVLYSSDTIDRNAPEFMDWKTLKKLSNNKQVTLGVLPASYSHITHLPEQEILKNLNKARQRFREEFNREAAFLSYPFGEYSTQLQTLAKTQGFKAALGLHSGATSPADNRYALPRFSMTERYGNLDRFRLVTNALPLPANDLEPADTYLKTQTWLTGFSTPTSLSGELKNLACFISGQEKPSIEILGNRVEIRSAELSTQQKRIRLNCTMPGPEAENGEAQWRWLGLLYHRNINSQAQDAPLPPQE